MPAANGRAYRRNDGCNLHHEGGPDWGVEYHVLEIVHRIHPLAGDYRSGNQVDKHDTAAVLGENVGHSSGLLANLAQGLAEVRIHGTGRDGGQKRHDEHGDAAGGHEH